MLFLFSFNQIASFLLIVYGSQNILYDLENKLLEPRSREKAGIWQLKAILIRKYSNDVVTYIEKLKIDLKKETGLWNETHGIWIYSKDEVRMVAKIFDRKGKKLFKKLKDFQQKTLNIDDQMQLEFSKEITAITAIDNSTGNKEQDFIKAFFHDISPQVAISMLSLFQNRISIIENKMLHFCNLMLDSLDGHNFFSFSYLIAQSSSYVRAGDKIEITAGIGSISRQAALVITIKGKKVPAGDDGVAKYHFKASHKPGKHIVPVRIDYTDQDGKKQSILRDMEYTVAK